MTAVAPPPSTEAVPARALAFPLPPEAIVVGGLFRSIAGPLKVMGALRASGAAGDVAGLVVPLPGDPDDPETLQQIARGLHRPRFNPLGYLMVVLDPHAPAPRYRDLIAGQNSILAHLVLGDLSGWISGVKTFRIPSSLTGDVSKAAAEGGVWVLGRSNHAAAVAGTDGAEQGGALGVLAGIGVPRLLAADFAARIAGGEVLLTTCETDADRARRDARWLKKNGATDMFERVVASARRSHT